MHRYGERVLDSSDCTTTETTLHRNQYHYTYNVTSSSHYIYSNDIYSRLKVAFIYNPIVDLVFHLLFGHNLILDLLLYLDIMMIQQLKHR